MDPQLAEYRRRQRERSSAPTLSAGAASGESESLLEKSITLPVCNWVLPLWQVALLVLGLGMLWKNVLEPYLFVWMFIAVVAGCAYLIDTRLRDDKEESVLVKFAARAKAVLDAQYEIGGFHVIGWHATGLVLLLSLFLGPWVIGWCALLFGGYLAWQQRRAQID
eukprot:TRINITY_DN80185_c0_g1_i1.p1 TRINITY_DN80185_c0_g1~~TRINITY_DN80185_c0_g1_i1.p1  ORF type:complete len:165 (+),score=29.64 TRINITY_DN80185_c0_g1_i1:55-549(+)